MQNTTVTFVAQNKVELVSSPVAQPAAGEVLLQTVKTLISQGTELAVLNKTGVSKGSVWSRDFPYPYQPGYANVAKVIGVGTGVSPDLVGKKVFSDMGHTAYGIKKAEEIYPLPDEITDEQMLLSVFANIALCGLRRSRLKLGETVAIFGLGMIGQLLAQLSMAAGALPIFCLERSQYRIDRLYHCEQYEIVRDAADMEESVRIKTKGRMCDIAFEATGSAGLIAMEPETLHPFGRLVMVSSPRGGTLFDFHDGCNRKSLEIIGAHNLLHTPVATYENPWTLRRDTELYLDLLRKGRLHTEGYVGKYERYTDAQQVYDALLSKRQEALGVVFTWEG